MKIISWNVAGINACVKKGLKDFVKKEEADIYCFQEIRTSEQKFPLISSDYIAYNYFAMKNGYSVTSVLTKIPPLATNYGVCEEKFDDEGRVIAVEFADFVFVNVYFPHAHRKLTRLDFKIGFCERFAKFIDEIKTKKPAIVAGDFNVAHTSIDLANPKQNEKNAGFTVQERKWFNEFLESGFVDSFRIFNKKNGNYTW